MKCLIRLASICLLLILCSTQTNAFIWEIAIRAIDSYGNAVVVTVEIYKLNPEGKYLEFVTSGSTKSGSFLECKTPTDACHNGAFDIHSTNYDSLDILDDNLTGGDYYIKIGNKYIYIDYDPHGYVTAYGDFIIQVQNSNQWSFHSISGTCAYDIYGPYLWEDTFSIELKNDFGNDKTEVSGNIKLNDEIHSDIGYIGTIFERRAGTFPHWVCGINGQHLNGFNRKWRKWNEDGRTIISRKLETEENHTCTAKYAKECNISFENSYGWDNKNGTIKVDGDQYNSPTSAMTLYDDITYSIEAQDQTIDGVYLTFDHWIKGEVNVGSSNPMDITPDINTTYTAKFTGRPTNAYRHLSFNDDEPGEEVVVTWEDHPLDNEEVTKYAIWRKIRQNNVTGPAVFQDTISATGASSYSYTDTGYIISNGYNGYIYYYDVKAYYAPDETYSNDDYVAVYAEAEPNIQTENPYQISTGETVQDIPLEYSLGNYPNPFNPTTTIRYSLAQNDFVTIKIYDMLGKEISTLINVEKPAGVYNVLFNANSLPSGVYIYSIVTNNFKQSKKMILTK